MLRWDLSRTMAGLVLRSLSLLRRSRTRADRDLSWLSDTAMMERVLPPNPDLETKEEAHSTWHIQDWRKLERKLHGPIFKCGGFPWWVIILAELVGVNVQVLTRDAGAFCSSLMGTTRSMSRFTSSMRGRISHQRIGMPVCSLRWCCRT